VKRLGWRLVRGNAATALARGGAAAACLVIAAGHLWRPNKQQQHGIDARTAVAAPHPSPNMARSTKYTTAASPQKTPVR
jgi:hypothetical protein